MSTDFFAFEDVTDHYGLAAYKPDIRDVEMDDAAVAYGLSTMAEPPALAVARNASDPIMPGASEDDARQAEKIYEQYGLYTTFPLFAREGRRPPGYGAQRQGRLQDFAGP